MVKTVIIPRGFTNVNLNENYFNPRYVKIQRGEFVTWVNMDNNSHILDFYSISNNEQPVYLRTLGPIAPNQSAEWEIIYPFSRIDYACRTHNNEIGSIIIYSMPEDQMTNTQQLRFLSEIFNIPYPPLQG